MRLVTASFVLASLLAIPAACSATPRQPPVAFETEPSEAAIGPGLHLVAHDKAIVFDYAGFFWTQHRGAWFRARGHRAAWARVPAGKVPRPVREQYVVELALRYVTENPKASLARVEKLARKAEAQLAKEQRQADDLAKRDRTRPAGPASGRLFQPLRIGLDPTESDAEVMPMPPCPPELCAMP